MVSKTEQSLLAPRVLLVAALAIALLSPTAPAEPSSTPREETWVANAAVTAIAATPTAVYIGGYFDRVGPCTGHGVPLSVESGQPSGTFPRVNGDVRTCTPDGAGGWYIGGSFTQVGSMPRIGLAHVLPSGAVDPSWIADANGGVYALAAQGMTVYAGGDFTRINGLTRNGIASMDAATGALTHWNPNPWLEYFDRDEWISRPGIIRAFALSGTTLYVGGWFTLLFGSSEFSGGAAFDTSTGFLLRAWEPNAWDSGGPGTISDLAASDTVVFAAGSFAHIGGEVRYDFAALDPLTGEALSLGGATDNGAGGWPTPPPFAVYALAISGSTLYVGGEFDWLGGDSRTNIAALDIATGLATPWAPSIDGYVYTLAVSGTTVYVGGAFRQIAGQPRDYVAALDATTGAATSWDPGLGAQPLTLSVSGPAIYVGGRFTSVGGQLRRGIAALDPLTGVLTAWDPGADAYVSALAVSDRTIYAGGGFSMIGGQPRYNIAALDAATGLATPWNPVSDGSVMALVAAAATLYAGGEFTHIGGQARNRIAALRSDTGTATAWNPGANGDVYALAVSQGLVYAGGDFTDIGGKRRGRIAALDALSGLATPWNPYADATVRALALSGGILYAGGGFTCLGNALRNCIGAVNTTTGLANDWDPGADNWVYSLAISGKTVYVGGVFAEIAGQARQCIAALSTRSGLAKDWNPCLPHVGALAISGSALYAGGPFRNVGEEARQGLAEFRAPCDVIVPNGNECWEPGSTHAIIWSSYKLAGDVRISLYQNWTKLRTLATVPVTDGIWTWAIPANETPSPDYRVRIEPLTASSKSGYSDGMFAIRGPWSLDLTAPNSPQSWSHGTQHPVMWSSANLTGTARVYLYTNWTKVRTIATVPITTGGYMWNIPASEPPGAAYRIRVQSLEYPSIQDYSKAPFTIAP